MEFNRVGNFSISDEIVFHCDTTMGAIQDLLSDVFICSAIHNFGYGRFEYIGISKHFDVVEAGQEAPTYIVHIDTDDKEVVAYFKKSNT